MKYKGYHEYTPFLFLSIGPCLDVLILLTCIDDYILFTLPTVPQKKKKVKIKIRLFIFETIFYFNLDFFILHHFIQFYTSFHFVYTNI